MARAYLCISIDTECDKGPGWRCQRPISFRGISDGVMRRVDPLFVSFRAKATYLLSPEIFRDPASVDALGSLNGSAELGTHLHGEYAEPWAFEPDVTRVFQRDYPEELERQKLTFLTDQFVSAFGYRPTSFRAGRFGLGPASLGILESLGYAVDSSVTPYIDWSSAGAADLSFHGAPTQPYRPALRLPARRGLADILEVPVTIRPRLANALPGIGRLIEPRWLRPTHESATSLIRVAIEEIESAQRAMPGRPVILNAMFHNVEIVPGASPYARTEAEARRILDRLGLLLAFAARERIPVVGLGDVPEILGV